MDISHSPSENLIQVFKTIRTHILIHAQSELKESGQVKSYIAVAGLVDGDFPLIDAFEANRGIDIFNSQNPDKKISETGSASCMQLAYNLTKDEKTIAISVSCDVLMSDENMTPEGKACWSRLPNFEKLKCSGAALHLVIDCYTPGLEWNLKSSHLISESSLGDAPIYASRLIL